MSAYQRTPAIISSAFKGQHLLCLLPTNFGTSVVPETRKYQDDASFARALPPPMDLGYIFHSSESALSIRIFSLSDTWNPRIPQAFMHLRKHLGIVVCLSQKMLLALVPAKRVSKSRDCKTFNEISQSYEEHTFWEASFFVSVLMSNYPYMN